MWYEYILEPAGLGGGGGGGGSSSILQCQHTGENDSFSDYILNVIDASLVKAH